MLDVGSLVDGVLKTSLTKSKQNVYHKGYGTHRSALTQMFSQTEIIPCITFQQKLRKCMTRKYASKARGTKESRLQEGNDPMPFIMYRELCSWLVEDDSAESIFAHCFLLLNWN
jgi:hypothetical protein